MSKGRVIILLADGFEEIEAISIIDILRRANINIKVVAIGDTKVKGAHGVMLLADENIDSICFSLVDVAILPGGTDGAYALRDNPKVQNLLKDLNAKNKLIAAICAAPVALDKAGVLQGREFTCYPSFEEGIASGTYTKEKDVIKSENIITSQSPSTAISFALELVKNITTESVSNKIRSEILYSKN